MNAQSPWPRKLEPRAGFAGEHNPIKRLAREFAMNGVNPASPWVLENSATARALYGNQWMHAAAEWIAGLHPHALQYLEQAPVLALAASFGGMASSRSQRAYIAMNFKPMCERGARLRDVMKAYHVAFPLRALSAASIRPGAWDVLKAISRAVDPSTIAQAIPARGQAHVGWVNALAVLQRRRPDDPANIAALRWMMLANRDGSAITPAVLDYVEQIADFMICNPGMWNPRWSYDRMTRETEQWHEALANAQISATGDGKYDRHVPYTGFPSEVTVNGHDFVALQSLRALIVEGKAMHHCVASYYRDICSGQTRIYSVREGGKRLATCEFRVLPAISGQGRVRAVQIKGPCNNRPCETVIRACDRFAELLTCPIGDLAKQPPATQLAFVEARG